MTDKQVIEHALAFLANAPVVDIALETGLTVPEAAELRAAADRLLERPTP